MIANGFLPTRGSLMLDFFCILMCIILAALSFSIFQVRYRKNKLLHRKIQVGTAIGMVFALILFEIDVRFFTSWRELAKPSPYYESGVVNWSLAIHLIIAIPTPFVWGLVIWTALKRFKDDFDQGDFNRFHRNIGRLAAALMFATALTGWIFYYLAFVAS